jgi:hypothetical protein
MTNKILRDLLIKPCVRSIIIKMRKKKGLYASEGGVRLAQLGWIRTFRQSVFL